MHWRSRHGTRNASGTGDFSLAQIFTSGYVFRLVMPQGKPPEKGPNPLLYLGLGVQLAVSVGLGVFAGQWLDRRVGTDGIFVLLGGMLGFASTMFTLVRMLGRRRGE